MEVEADDDLQFRLLEQELPSWHSPYICCNGYIVGCIPNKIVCIDAQHVLAVVGVGFTPQANTAIIATSLSLSGREFSSAS